MTCCFLRFSPLLFVSLLALSPGCGSGDGGPSETIPTPTPLVGAWQSAGDDVAPVLAQFGVARIDATFGADGRYEVTACDDQEVCGSVTGTWISELPAPGTAASDAIRTIRLEEDDPPATFEGIYEVDETAVPPTMLYEVVQTDSSIVVAPPTAEAGFGSTDGGAYGTGNVQRYVRLED
jgi:hypothetical protein